jgi:hypothetical protein
LFTKPKVCDKLKNRGVLLLLLLLLLLLWVVDDNDGWGDDDDDDDDAVAALRCIKYPTSYNFKAVYNR